MVGVGRVSADPVFGSTTVIYNSGTPSLQAIQAAINECGFHCAGEALLKQVCESHAMAKWSSCDVAISEITGVRDDRLLRHSTAITEQLRHCNPGFAELAARDPGASVALVAAMAAS